MGIAGTTVRSMAAGLRRCYALIIAAIGARRNYTVLIGPWPYETAIEGFRQPRV